MSMPKFNPSLYETIRVNGLEMHRATYCRMSLADRQAVALTFGQRSGSRRGVAHELPLVEDDSNIWFFGEIAEVFREWEKLAETPLETLQRLVAARDPDWASVGSAAAFVHGDLKDRQILELVESLGGPGLEVLAKSEKF